jgi:hypothetical protein
MTATGIRAMAITCSTIMAVGTIWAIITAVIGASAAINGIVKITVGAAMAAGMVAVDAVAITATVLDTARLINR